MYELFVQISDLSKKVKNFDSIITAIRRDRSEREESDSDDDNSDDGEDNNYDDNSDNKEVSEECTLSEAEEKEAASTTSNSPYWKIFKAIKIKILKDTTCTDTKNNFFCQKFVRYIADFLMPYFPLWFAINLTKVGLYRDNNAPVENHYKIPAPRLIMQNFKFIKGSLKERKFSLKTTRQNKKKSEERDNNPVESWKRRQKGHLRSNRFLKYDKFVSAIGKQPTFTPQLLELANVSEVQVETLNLNNDDDSINILSASMNCDEDVEQNSMIVESC